ncbi:MAG TPA: amino acid adenylation domain-containing protein [Pseudonocardiaceae bacterium]|nr:amino acid adenylation domain-containing protein [Pseudonocardiaceae bacterium]
MVLKLLRDAIGAGDNVQAVLKGIAVNHNGYRMASMSAPSQLAQTEVIADAWRDAGVDPRTVRYVECHGSATPLGDVVEVDGLRRAFVDAGVRTPSCVFGSIKGNIGHLDNAAGIAGLLKVVLSVRRGVLYPTAHFSSPNPLLDLSGPVQVNVALRDWPDEPGTPRRAGLSSFGLTGTNAHAVVEQPPPPPVAPGPARACELVTLSARSAAALGRYRDRLADFAERTGHDLAEIAHAMNRGRDDYPYRIAVTAEDRAELVTALRRVPVPDTPVPDEPPVVLLFSGDGGVDPECWQGLCAAFGDLPADPGPDGSAARLVAVQSALHRLACSLGLTGNHLVGSGAGNVAVRIARAELSLADGLAAVAGQALTTDVDRDRLHQAVRGFVRDGAVLVELGAGGVLSRTIRRIAPELGCVELVAGVGRRGVLRQLGSLYRLGVRLDWDRYYQGAAVARIEAPTYPFDPIRCWCRPAGEVPEGDESAEPVRTASARAGTERRIAEVWRDVLGAEELAPDAHYFALGGTSIAGISVLRTVERDFGVALTFADLYAHPTVREFAERVDQLCAAADRPADDRAIPCLRRGGALPVSFGQEQLWYLDQLNPGTALYNIPHDLRLTGTADHAALAGAVRDLIARHEVLRTRVAADDDGEPHAWVRAGEPDLRVVDLTGLSEVDRMREARELAAAEAVRPFDLAAGPLVRTVLLRLADDDHVLVWTYHHIVFDGWSPTVFFRDLAELYRARLAGRTPALPELPVQYADYAGWQRNQLTGATLARGLEFWRAELAGLRRDDLPLDRPRPPVQTGHGALVEFSVDADLAGRVRRFSQRHGVTTFVTMLALVDVLLHQWAGLTDVVIGVATSGRVNPATHDLIGYFNNVLPFRTPVRPDVPFTDLVRRCASTVAGVLDHEEMPLEKIVAEVCGRRDPDRHPLFDVAYTYQNVPQNTAELAGLRCSRLLDDEGSIVGIAPGTAKFDLTVGVIDQHEGPMGGYLEYATALFDAGTVRRLAGWLPALLAAALDDPDRPIADLARPGDGEPGAVRLVEQWAARTPEHPAVQDAEGNTLTYRELNRLANRLARGLAESGVGPDVAVPVAASRGFGLVIGWLAVAKAGGAYVPIDMSAPAARIDELVAGTGGPVVLTDDDLRVEPTSEADDDNPRPTAGPANLAYVGYTSGSTGRPQGCQIEWHNLTDVVRWYRDTAGITEHDRLLQAVSPGFDAAALEVWGALCCGATVCVLPTMLTEPGRLLGWIAEQRVTVAFLPTPLAEVVLTEGEWSADLRLRVLCTGGDLLRFRPPADAPFRVLNLYGPTECTVASTAGYVGPGDTVPGIGRPVTGTAIHLLDPCLREVQNGQWGEVYVGGAAVGRGYHRKPGLTAARFVADPFARRAGARMYRTGDLARIDPDGTLRFGGRVDDQVEIRGQRVEPAEVERTLTAHPRVREALVMTSAAPSGSARLVAHVTGDAPDPAELVDWAAARLPGYMVPAEVVVSGSLPRTPNGKLDRRSLRAMPTPSTIHNGANGHAERMLTEICADLLAVPEVTPRDNFFDLGGDSILGVRVAARAAKAGVQFTPQQLLQCHTIGELAAAAIVDEPDPVGPTIAEPPPSAPPGRGIPLTPIMHNFLERLPSGARGFVEVHALETTRWIGADTVRTAVTHLLAMHEPLRYRLCRNALGARFECGTVDPAAVFDTKVLPPLTDDDELAVVTEDCQAMQDDLDPHHGSVIRVRHYDRGRRRGCLIVLLVNHFVFDNMSTVVLLDDLDTLLTDLTAGRTAAAAPQPPRWREWSRHLRDMASSDELAAELTYWTATLGAGAGMGPIGGTGGDGVAAADRTIVPDRVADVLIAGAGQGREAALCAAACGLARWRGTTSAYLMTEGEATPNVYRPAGCGPSVGWFTTLHPMVLPVEPGMSVRDCLPVAADRIRSVPNDGVGYGVLRHLAPHSAAVARLRSLPEPDVIMLHGPSDAGAFDSGVRLLRTRWDLSVNLKQPVMSWFPVIVSSAVREGGLRVVVASSGALGQEEIDHLADEIVGAFIELAAP